MRFKALFAKRWVKISTLLLVAIIGLEVVMRLTGLALMLPTHWLNVINPADENKIRILAIGESTTADFFSAEEKGAWPRRLESKLKLRGIEARVYNEGLSGTMTPMIISHIPDYIEKYRPHIVISMMGINDIPFVKYDGSYTSEFNLMLSQIRLLKLLKWTGDKIEYLTNCRFTEVPSKLTNFQDYVKKGFHLSEKFSVPEVEQELRKSIFDDHDLALVFKEIGLKLREVNQNQIARKYFDRAFDLSPYDRYIAFFELNQLTRVYSSSRCKEVTQKLFKCGRNLPDDLIAQILYCTGRDKSLLPNDAFNFRKVQISQSPDYHQKYHYRILHQILRDKGISLIAMQYPTLPLDKLKHIFKNEEGQFEAQYADILFVSNQENFAEALKSHHYDEVFMDRFKGSWGHTTGLGHDLLAESALKEVLELIQKEKFK